MKRDGAFYRKLFWTMFKLSAFTFGGGYVIVPLMKKQFVDGLGWLDEQEMLNYTALAQSAPGAVAVNASVLIGFRLAGWKGALLSAAATILPPLLLLSVLTYIYEAIVDNRVVAGLLRGMQAGVCAVIIQVVMEMGGTTIREKNGFGCVVMVAVFLAVAFLDLHVLAVIVIAALIGLVRMLFIFRKGGGVRR